MAECEVFNKSDQEWRKLFGTECVKVPRSEREIGRTRVRMLQPAVAVVWDASLAMIAGSAGIVKTPGGSLGEEGTEHRKASTRVLDRCRDAVAY